MVAHTESLYSMAEIATGNGDALAQHDMIARHRIPLPTGLICLDKQDAPQKMT